MEAIIDQVRTNPKKYLGITMPIKSEYSYLEKKVVDVEEFSVTAKSKRADGINKETIIHVDHSSIVEEDADTSNILRTQDISTLTGARVKRKTKAPDTLKLTFSQGPAFRYHLRSYELDYLLANVLSSVLSKEDVDAAPILLRENAPKKLRIIGIPPDADTTYEISLNRAIAEACGCKDLMSETFESLLMEAALNVRPKDYDPKFVATLFGALGELAQTLRGLETDEEAKKEYAEFLGKRPELAKGRSLLRMYRELPVFLYYLRSHICIRAGLTELSVYQKQLEILLSLAGSRDPLVSFMASLALRAFLRVYSGANMCL